MKKSLIRGLIWAFLGVLLFTASTHTPFLNKLINDYSYFIIAFGIALFIYVPNLSLSIQPIAQTIAGISIFRGLVSVPYITGIIAKYPLIIIGGVIVFSIFHDEIFEMTRLQT